MLLQLSELYFSRIASTNTVVAHKDNCLIFTAPYHTSVIWRRKIHRVITRCPSGALSSNLPLSTILKLMLNLPDYNDDLTCEFNNKTEHCALEIIVTIPLRILKRFKWVFSRFCSATDYILQESSRRQKL